MIFDRARLSNSTNPLFLKTAGLSSFNTNSLARKVPEKSYDDFIILIFHKKMKLGKKSPNTSLIYKSQFSAMFQQKPDFSTSCLHDRILRHQFMIEQNRQYQSYFWNIFTPENYYVCVWEVFLKFRIPTKFNLTISVHSRCALFRFYKK